MASLPTRVVWIEIGWDWDYAACRSHSPHGECGLKFPTIKGSPASGASLPTRGVWIEILTV